MGFKFERHSNQIFKLWGLKTWMHLASKNKSFTYCHTRPYLGIEAQLKIWKPTHPTTRPPGDLDSFAFIFNHFSFWQISLVGSSPNFKLKLMWLNPTTRISKMRTTSNGRGPQILKVKFLNNHWSDFPQIINLSFCD